MAYLPAFEFELFPSRLAVKFALEIQCWLRRSRIFDDIHILTAEKPLETEMYSHK